jgi:hypothetical protein
VMLKHVVNSSFQRGPIPNWPRRDLTESLHDLSNMAVEGQEIKSNYTAIKEYRYEVVENSLHGHKSICL